MATIDDEAFLGREMGGVGLVPMIELQVDRVSLFAAQGARVATESAMMLFDVPNHRLRLRLNDFATRTLELRLCPFTLGLRRCLEDKMRQIQGSKEDED